jgi:hypothetical protein
MSWLEKYKEGGETKEKPIKEVNWADVQKALKDMPNYDGLQPHQIQKIEKQKTDVKKSQDQLEARIQSIQKANPYRKTTREEAMAVAAGQDRQARHPATVRQYVEPSNGQKFVGWLKKQGPLSPFAWALGQSAPKDNEMNKLLSYFIPGIGQAKAFTESAIPIAEGNGTKGDYAMLALSALPTAVRGVMGKLPGTAPKDIAYHLLGDMTGAKQINNLMYETAPRFMDYSSAVMNDVVKGKNVINAVKKNMMAAEGDITNLAMTSNESPIEAYKRIKEVNKQIKPGNSFSNESYSTDSYPLTLDYLKRLDPKEAKIIYRGFESPINTMGHKNPQVASLLEPERQALHKEASKKLEGIERKLKSEHPVSTSDMESRIRLQTEAQKLRTQLHYEIMPQVGTPEYETFATKMADDMNTRISEINKKFRSKIPTNSKLRAVEDGQLEGLNMLHTPQLSIVRRGATPMQELKLNAQRVGLSKKNIKNPFVWEKKPFDPYDIPSAPTLEYPVGVEPPVEFNEPTRWMDGYIIEADGGEVTTNWLNKYK